MGLASRCDFKCDFRRDFKRDLRRRPALELCVYRHEIRRACSVLAGPAP